MPLYLLQAKYVPATWKALRQHPQDRSTAIVKLVQPLGGRVLSFYYCIGEYDAVGIMEAPDDITAQAAVVAGLEAGHLQALHMTKLFTVEEITQALQKANNVSLSHPANG